MAGLVITPLAAAAGSREATAQASSTRITNPRSNTVPIGLDFCKATSARIDTTCRDGAISDFDRARAREGLPPIVLPSNFSSLSVRTQLFVLANIDRVDRGLTPVKGLSGNLQPIAQRAAKDQEDPIPPRWAVTATSNQASTVNALWSDFVWMYDDGYESNNLDCDLATDPGCWGHRDDIVAPFDSPVLMGTGSSKHGDTQLFVGSDKHDNADLMTWASELKHFSIGFSPAAVDPTPARTTTTNLSVFASALPMTVHASVTSGSSQWSVSPSTCDVMPGSRCTLAITHHPGGGPTSPDTLRLTGPNGSVEVPLGSVPKPDEPRVTVQSSQLRVAWDSVAPGVTYVASASPGGQHCTTTHTSCTIKGLSNGRHYRITIKAHNAYGHATSPRSASVTPKIVVPSQPAPPKVTVKGHTLTMTWKAPYNGGSAITSYFVQRSWKDPDIVSGTTRRLVFHHVPSGAQAVAVQAVTNDSFGPSSPLVWVRVPH